MKTSYVCGAGLKDPSQFPPVKEEGSVSGLRWGRICLVWTSFTVSKRSTYSLSKWLFKLNLQIGRAGFWIMPASRCSMTRVCCLLVLLVWTAIKSMWTMHFSRQGGASYRWERPPGDGHVTVCLCLLGTQDLLHKGREEGEEDKLKGSGVGSLG